MAGMPSQYRTVFTQAGVTSLLIQPTELVFVSLQLHSAGPVVVGSANDLSPLGSGKGFQLTTVPRYFPMNPNTDVLYIYADTVQQVSMVVTPMSLLSNLINAIAPPQASPAIPNTVKIPIRKPVP